MTHKLTADVCQLLGVTPAALNSWLSRHEKYKPKLRNRAGFLWTDDEVAAVQAARVAPPLSKAWRKKM